MQTNHDSSALLARLHAEALDELTVHILPFWMQRTPDDVRGGFIGQILQDGTPVSDAPKGGILNARILWTFSAAFERFGDAAYRALADRAAAYIDAHLWDAEHGGLYWSVDADGQPLEDRKHVYANAFYLYALAAHYEATGHRPSLERAIRIFQLIERHAHDPEHGGYFESFERDWRPMGETSLGEGDLAAPKSQNTLLHVLEAYTGLYRVWPDALLGQRLAELVEVFLTRVLDPERHHLRLFFQSDWTLMGGDAVSYGHDIEASWLLTAAAEALGIPELRERVARVAVEVAHATRREGQDADGGIYNELHADGSLDDTKDWWPQAEAAVGYLNAWQLSGDAGLLDAAARAWDFARRCMTDRVHGEWLWKVRRDGTPLPGFDKVGLWKCPYHNSRACLELIARIEAVQPALH